MITVHTTPEDLVEIRFAYSPLIELTASYAVLGKPQRQIQHKRWLDETRRALYNVELPYLYDLVLASQQRYIPDFLTPTPVSTRLALADEIERMLALPDDLIRKNIQYLIDKHGATEIRQFFLAYPRESLLCLVEDIHLYWKRTLEHHWPRLAIILENDVLYHARRLALDGVTGLFATLHPKIVFQPQRMVIGIQKSHHDEEHYLRGDGLQLVPAVFACDHISWQIEPEWRPMFIYGARGVGQWRPETQETNPSLELALGMGRARVLQALLSPTSTGELALKLQVSSGAISQHLDRLHQAGLVEPQRSGKRVYYRLTPRGAGLLALFDSSTLPVAAALPSQPPG
jgi:DNA-binding MarR family transcriptional regulator